MARSSHATTGHGTHGLKLEILEYGQFGSSGHPALAHMSFHASCCWRRQHAVCRDDDVIQGWEMRVGIVAVMLGIVSIKGRS
jgi:hypothetical protein